jgi:hypothetical protein
MDNFLLIYRAFVLAFLLCSFLSSECFPDSASRGLGEIITPSGSFVPILSRHLDPSAALCIPRIYLSISPSFSPSLSSKPYLPTHTPIPSLFNFPSLLHHLRSSATSLTIAPPQIQEPSGPLQPPRKRPLQGSHQDRHRGGRYGGALGH